MSKEVKIESNFCQLFIDTGNGFNEKESIRIPVTMGENEVQFDVSKFKNLTALRFDPLDNYTIFNASKFDLLTEDKAHKCAFKQFNGWYISDKKDEIIFDNEDPNIILENIDAPIVTVDIKFNIQSPVKALEYVNNLLKADLKALNEQQDTTAKKKESSENAMTQKLLKSINGKLNLQVAEIDYIKSLFGQFSNNQGKLIKALAEAEDNNEKTQLEEKITSLKSVVKETEFKLQKKNETIEKLKADIVLLKEKIRSKEEFAETLAHTLDEKIQDLNSIQDEAMSSHIEKETREMKLKNEKLSELISEYKAQIKILKGNEKELKKEMSKLFKLNQKNYAQLEVEKHKTGELETKLKNESSKMNSLQADLQRLQTKFDNLKKEFHAMTKIEAKHYRLIEELSLLSSHL